MKKQLLLIASLFIFSFAMHSQSENLLVGQVSTKQILEINENWKKNFDEYVPGENITRLFRVHKNNLSFEIHMGSWCEDSENWIPKLIKIFEITNQPASSIRFIGFDRSKEIELDGQKIKTDFLPTIIVKRNGVAIGSIIENPKVDLEKDLETIIALP